MKQTIYILTIVLFQITVNHASNVLPLKQNHVLSLVNKLESKIPTDPIFFEKTTIKPSQTQIANLAVEAGQSFSFPEVDAKINTQIRQHHPGLILDENTLIDGNDFLADVFQKADRYKVHEKVVKANEILDEAIAIGKIIQKIDEGELVTFPLLMSDTVNNIIYTIAVNNVRLKPAYAELEVYLGIEIPDKDIVLYFGSSNVKFSSKTGIVGDAVLGLYAEVPIAIGGQKSALVIKPYRQNPAVNPDIHPDDPNLHQGTFVHIDCDGFKGMGLDAEVHFSKDWIVPTNLLGNPVSNRRVVGRIQTYLYDWNDILTVVDLPNFALANNTDIQFELAGAVLDFSDFRNDPSVQFPARYAEQHLLPGNPNLWRGIFIRHVEITLPKVFKKKNCVAEVPSQQNDPAGNGSIQFPQQNNYTNWVWNDPFREKQHGPAPTDYFPEINVTRHLKVESENCRFSFGAQNLLIDNMGVSGEFFATNVIRPGESGLNNWRFSLDSVNIDVVVNNITGFGFSGELGLPISKETQNFFYSAFVDESRNYFFSLGIADEMDFPLWKAGEVVIEEGSRVEVAVIDDEFYPTAVLNGAVNIGFKHNESDNRKLVDAPAIGFRELVIKTTKPFIGIGEQGYFRVSGNIGVANFPVSVDSIKLVALPGDECGLHFTIRIEMMNARNHGFAAFGGFTVAGKLHETDGVHTWAYKEFLFDDAELFIILPTIEGHGWLRLFRGDQTFGNGFQAGMTLDVMDQKFTIDADAVFGKTLSGGEDGEGYRYWYIDGMTTFSPAIPIAGPLGINGFGGGLYHHMKMAAYDPDYHGPGATNSGMIYAPDEETIFGLKASVSFLTLDATQVEEGVAESNGTFQGMATLQMEFGEEALQNISLLATARFMQGGDGAEDSESEIVARLNARKGILHLEEGETKDADKREARDPAQDIRASLHIVMDFENEFELNGLLQVYMKVANGRVSGVGPHYLAGAAHFLIKRNPNIWHLYVGGYFDNSIVVEGFNEQEVVMSPVGVRLQEGELQGRAEAYFMIGNDLPGPGAVPVYVIDEFHLDPENIINMSNTSERMARGTGFAFGASVRLTYNIGGGGGFYADIGGSIGFTIALLKYRTGAFCSPSGQTPIGMKGWRANGNIWAEVHARGKAFWVPFNLGIGVFLAGSIPNPSRFYCKANILGWRPDARFGEVCFPVEP